MCLQIIFDAIPLARQLETHAALLEREPMLSPCLALLRRISDILVANRPGRVDSFPAPALGEGEYST